MSIGLAFAILILRIATGLAVVLLGLPARQVPSGFYRVQLWIVMGLNTLAALLLARSPSVPGGWWLGVAAAAAAYVAAVLWLYELPLPGWLATVAVALLDGWALGKVSPPWGDDATSTLLMGTILTAMLLGHWYLNSPTMQLAPLRRLLLMVAGALMLRGAWEIGGGWRVSPPPHAYGAWWALRWVVGLVATAFLSGMTWLTLRIPNTQSATGILYVAVVLVFLGESISLLQWL